MKFLKKVVESLNKYAQSATSNQWLSRQGKYKDEDTMIQLIEDMKIGEQETSIHTATILEEVISHHTFCYLLFFKVIGVLNIFYRQNGNKEVDFY